MYPIVDERDRRGEVTTEIFTRRFRQVCESAQGRVKHLALIFYSSKNQNIVDVLGNNDLVLGLDRKTGKDIGVFYLHPRPGLEFNEFNRRFSTVFGFDENIDLPCIVFFRIEEQSISSVKVVQIFSGTRDAIFSELFTIFDRYVAGRLYAKQQRKIYKIVYDKVSSALIPYGLDKVIEFLRALLP